MEGAVIFKWLPFLMHRKGEVIMAKIWRNRIIAGDQEYAHCPARYKAAVLALLRQDVVDGTITAERFEELTGEPYAA